MMSNWMMIALLAQYVVLAVVAAYEQGWSKSVYFIGAAVIQIGVLMMSAAK